MYNTFKNVPPLSSYLIVKMFTTTTTLFLALITLSHAQTDIDLPRLPTYRQTTPAGFTIPAPIQTTVSLILDNLLDVTQPLGYKLAAIIGVVSPFPHTRDIEAT